MSAAVMRNNEASELANAGMNGPVTASMVFHGCMLLLMIVGLPFIKPRLPEIAEPMTVEIVSAQEAQSDKRPTHTENPRTAIAEKPPEEVKPPQAPTVTAKTPPKPVAPSKPDDVVMPSEKPEEDIKKPDPKKLQPPKKPEKRPVLTQASEEEQTEAFQSVLRNLMPADPQAASADSPDKTDESSPVDRFAQQLSMGEQDALRGQLAQCWNVMAGARYAEELVVDVKLFVNPDRTVRDAQVVDQFRYYSDSHFRAAADAALRAVYNPRCNPLELPPEKYDQWKVTIVTFDPREML